LSRVLDTSEPPTEPVILEKVPLELRMDDPEARQKAALARYQRSFKRLAVFCVLVAFAGFIVGSLLSGLARALVIAMVGFGGLLVAWMAMVIRKRIRSGPKMQ
jgi:hypothetical protein